ncbi:helix-turn-helix domain-containing protein [Rahnella aquatilis]|uniref:Transcriptional regulator, AraC family n=1 Tax=Rahnella sp. (strain Y9602) TaxID=2703885 RepID=A0A0H3FCI4_RAHSY|nr:helix-turn-helix domain-containing protein [Rahnella aceris]ADW73805.1 transcriptional regulator, AraC family [Rahnella aceris]AFE58453.1 AraC family transcriptional regulator [Rahnella aquatilis HX2]AZP42297.1 helix-turn-helix domain-containing protein [Rahnella aquatilis]AZP46637.1 helix-turn-helix domain-containing protein [Rahnella aquatilis]
MNTFLIIVPDGGMLFEAAGIADILMQANRLLPLHATSDSKIAPYQVTVATTQPHRVIHGVSGLNLLADHRLCDLDPTLTRDTILVTGKGLSEEEGSNVVCWLQQAAPHARRVVSVCGGAVLLAQAGLLNGRHATTHWRLIDTLQAQYPQVTVERGPMYVQDGPVWTSGGVSSGFDLTLALVEEDHGFSIAKNVAQDLVMFLRRPGGQSQFSRYLLNQASNGSIRELQAWLAENLNSDLSVENLAERVAMSPRNFTRVFTRETGITPAKYVEEVRLSAARQLLEQTTQNIDRIALTTGFGGGLNLRRVFERNLQLTPTEYRERFCSRYLA